MLLLTLPSLLRYKPKYRVMSKKRTIRVGLKANAHFLFSQMLGDTLGGVTGGVSFSSIVFLNERQFEKFKTLIAKFFGDIEKSLKANNSTENVDFQCYFVKR